MSMRTGKEKAAVASQLNSIRMEDKRYKNETILGSREVYEDTPRNSILAKTIDHCLEKNLLADFKEPNKMLNFIKENNAPGIISMHGNVMVYNSGRGIVVHYDKQDKNDSKIGHHSEIYFEENGPLSGRSSFPTVSISDINEVSVNNLSESEKELYREMYICRHLLNPIIKKLNLAQDRKRTWEELIAMEEEEKRKWQKEMEEFYKKSNNTNIQEETTIKKR